MQDIAHVRNRCEFEGPDFYSILGNEMMIIEHFEIDSAKRTRAGSTIRFQHAALERDTEKNIKAVEEEYFKNGRMSTLQTSSALIELPIRNFIDNATSIFSHHYERIHLYKDNLLKSGLLKANLSIRTCFIIQDTTPGGSSFYNGIPIDGKCGDPLILLCCPSFLEKFDSSKDLDCIITINPFKGGYVSYVNRTTIPYYSRKLLNIERIEDSGIMPVVQTTRAYGIAGPTKKKCRWKFW